MINSSCSGLCTFLLIKLIAKEVNSSPLIKVCIKYLIGPHVLAFCFKHIAFSNDPPKWPSFYFFLSPFSVLGMDVQQCNSFTYKCNNAIMYVCNKGYKSWSMKMQATYEWISFLLHENKFHHCQFLPLCCILGHLSKLCFEVQCRAMRVIACLLCLVERWDIKCLWKVTT